MGYRDAPLVKGAPGAIVQPVQPTETPGFRAQVAGATSTASTLGQGTWSEDKKTLPDGRIVVGQKNNLTGEFKPYPKEMQPSAEVKLNPTDLAAARQDALRRAVIAKGLEQKSKDWFSTGFLAPTLSQYGGTNAFNVQQDIDALKSGGALDAIIDMAKKTGKNLLTPMSKSDADLIANAKQFPLAIGQDDDKFQQNARRYYEAARRAYLGAGGSAKDFETQVLRLSGRANSRASGIKVERIK